MKHIFITTEFTNKFDEMCRELMSPTSLIGPSLAMVTGPAGRGKSEAAQHYAVHSNAVYVPPMNIRTPTMVLREIAFNLQNIRPQRSDVCIHSISESMAQQRRLILIDEADLLPMQILEMLRNLNECCACPIVLIGEDSLRTRIATRRRISSRIRCRLEFGPVSREDITFFIKASLGVKANADVIAGIHRHAGGDWRPILTTVIAIDRAMKASNAQEITVGMVKNVLKNA